MDSSPRDHTQPGRCLADRACCVRFKDGISRICAAHANDDAALDSRVSHYAALMRAPDDTTQPGDKPKSAVIKRGR